MECVRLNIEQMIADHHGSVYGYAYRLTGVVADAEDLTQQTFLVAQQKIHQLRDDSKAQGWLFAVLRSCHFRQYRKRTPIPAAKLELRVDEIPESVQADDFSIDPDDLQRALNTLPCEFRTVVLLFYFEQKSYKQIASELELPMGTVMSRLFHARKNFQKALSRYLR